MSMVVSRNRYLIKYIHLLKLTRVLQLWFYLVHLHQDPAILHQSYLTLPQCCIKVDIRWNGPPHTSVFSQSQYFVHPQTPDHILGAMQYFLPCRPLAFLPSPMPSRQSFSSPSPQSRCPRKPTRLFIITVISCSVPE